MSKFSRTSKVKFLRIFLRSFLTPFLRSFRKQRKIFVVLGALENYSWRPKSSYMHLLEKHRVGESTGVLAALLEVWLISKDLKKFLLLLPKILTCQFPQTEWALSLQMDAVP